jgi:hypothetical protein
MRLKMKKLTSSIFALLALVAALPASAVPVRATFSGSVSGSSGFFTNVLNDFPAGTAASFDVTFDDSGLLPSAPLTDFDLAPVSGWLRLGSLEWLLDAGSLWTYSYMLEPGNPIVSYGLQLTGSGPTIGGNASLFGLFLRLTPDLEPTTTNPFSAGFGYPVQNGTFYSYADLAGTHTITRGVTVPEPNTTMLMLSGFALLAFVWRRSRAAGTARG